jgi:hypothetical protein
MQSGWTKYGEENSLLSENVMVVGAMPHDWLFKNVCGVIHHGGAGTTSAGLRSGNPTFICPFFGDQHFWAEMVNRAGAGPGGCPIGQLTTAILTDAFETLRDPATIANVAKLQEKMVREDGVTAAIESFNRNLPLRHMICELSPFDGCKSKLARIYCNDCGFHMCLEMDKLIHRFPGPRTHHNRVPYKSVQWGLAQSAITKVRLHIPFCMLNEQLDHLPIHSSIHSFIQLINQPIMYLPSGGEP